MAESVRHTLDNRALGKASQVLSGIVTGIVADGQLHDMEIQMLSTWLAENRAVVEVWPGSAISALISQVLEDGHISESERTHLLQSLQALVGSDFAETGSVTTEVAALPFDPDPLLLKPGSRLCFTGSFLFGTRAACEQITEKVGLEISAAVSRKVTALVVGTNISPDWINTSYGQKIIKAMELKGQGHDILIVHERDWLNAIQPT